MSKKSNSVWDLRSTRADDKDYSDANMLNGVIESQNCDPMGGYEEYRKCVRKRRKFDRWQRDGYISNEPDDGWF